MDFRSDGPLVGGRRAHIALLHGGYFVCLLSLFSLTDSVLARAAAVGFLTLLSSQVSLALLTMHHRVEVLERSLWLDELTWRELYQATRSGEVVDWAEQSAAALKRATDDIERSRSATRFDPEAQSATASLLISLVGILVGIAVEVGAAILLSRYIPGWLVSVGLAP